MLASTRGAVAVERVDEVLRDVVPGLVRETLLGEKRQRRVRPPDAKVRDAAVVEQDEPIKRLEHGRRGLVDADHERALGLVA